MTFLPWLLKQKERQDPVGDFSRDAISCRNQHRWKMPLCRRSWHRFIDVVAYANHGVYWQRLVACTGAHKALDAAWDEFICQSTDGRYRSKEQSK